MHRITAAPHAGTACFGARPNRTPEAAYSGSAPHCKPERHALERGIWRNRGSTRRRAGRSRTVRQGAPAFRAALSAPPEAKSSGLCRRTCGSPSRRPAMSRRCFPMTESGRAEKLPSPAGYAAGCRSRLGNRRRMPQAAAPARAPAANAAGCRLRRYCQIRKRHGPWPCLSYAHMRKIT